MGRVAIVTDSTCDLPAAVVEAAGIRVVPLSVAFGLDTYVSGVTISTAGFYARLLADTSRLPTTSQPAPVWFEEAYAAAAADDEVSAIVSLHVSAALSGTVSLARDRAARAPIDVEVVDTRLVGGALGMAVLAAHRVAAAGGTVAEVVAAAERVRDRALTLLVVDDLQALRRGGRLTGAQTAVGGALRVKPLLHLVDGRVEVRERTRTWSRALERVGELVEQAAAGGEVDVLVAEALAPQRARQVWEQLARRVTIGDRVDAEIGPIVGAHVGSGAIGVTVVPQTVRPQPGAPGA